MNFILNEIKAQRIEPGLCEVTVKMIAASGEADLVCAQVKGMLFPREITAEVNSLTRAVADAEARREIAHRALGESLVRLGE